MSSSRAFARIEFRDQIRDRGAMLGRIAPVISILIGATLTLLIGLFTEDDDQTSRGIFNLAVAENVFGLAPEFEGVLDPDRFTVVISADPAADVTDEASDAGLITDDGRRFTVLVSESRSESEAAARVLHSTLLELDLAVNPEPTKVPLVVVEADASACDLRQQLAIAIPAALLFFMGSVMANTAQQFVAGKQSGALAMHMTLPIPRRSFVLAKGGTEALLTLVGVSPFLLAAIVAATATVLVDGALFAAAGVFALSAFLIVSTVVLYTVGGLIFAVRSPKAASSSGLSIGPTIGAALLLVASAALGGQLPLAIALVPLAGLAAALGNLIGAYDLIPLLPIAVSSTAIAVAVGLRSIERQHLDQMAIRSE